MKLRDELDEALRLLRKSSAHIYRQQFAAHGMSFSGSSPDGKLVEIVELPEHPWFVACQFHPEFKSKPTQAQPLFAGFIAAAIEQRTARAQRNQELAIDEEIAE